MTPENEPADDPSHKGGEIRQSGLLPQRTGEISILHLSDLHFRKDTRIEGERKSDHLHYLERNLRDCVHNHGRPDLVAVTGDLVDGNNWGRKAHKEALRRAREYLEHLSKLVLGCDWGEIVEHHRVLVVPGNHDVRVKGNLGRPAFRKHFRDYFGDFGEHTWYRELGLLVGCFDSNRMPDKLGLALGFVRSRQFDELHKAIGRLSGEDRGAVKDAFRIGLVHHHPLPIVETEARHVRERIERVVRRKLVGAQEFLLLTNAGTFLERLMQDDFRVLLHGHLHFPVSWKAGKYTLGKHRSLRVLACGPAGVADHQGNMGFNHVRIPAPAGAPGPAGRPDDEARTEQCIRYTFSGTGVLFDPELIPTDRKSPQAEVADETRGQQPVVRSRREPGARDLSSQLGQIEELFQAGEEDRARELVSKLAASLPNDSRPVVQLSRLLLKKGRVEDAVNYLETQRERYPEDPYFFRGLGYAFQQADDPAKALKARRIAVAKDPEDPRSRIGCAFSLWALGNVDEAIREAETGLQLAQRDERHSQLRPMLENSLAYYLAERQEEGDKRRARGLAADALDRQPENPLFLDTKGFTWIAWAESLDDIDQGVGYYLKALEKGLDPAVGAKNLRAAYEKRATITRSR